MQIKPRKVVQMSGSHYVSLPKDWLFACDILRGDFLDIEIKDNKLIIQKNEEESKIYRETGR